MALLSLKLTSPLSPVAERTLYHRNSFSKLAKKRGITGDPLAEYAQSSAPGSGGAKPLPRRLGFLGKPGTRAEPRFPPTQCGMFERAKPCIQ